MEKQDLLKLTNWTMPFGKYSGRLLIDLPEDYLLWFMQKGLPPGELGRLMSIVYEVKLNGLESLFDQLR